MRKVGRILLNILGVIGFVIAIVWWYTGNGCYEPIYTVVAATASLIAAFLLRPKGKGEKTNTIITEINDKSPIFQGNIQGPVNIDNSTTVNHYNINLDEFIEKLAAENRERIKAETQIKETEDSHSIKIADSNNNIIIQSNKGNITIKIEEIPYVAELREQIEALQIYKKYLQDQVDTKDELLSLKMSELSGQIADLEKQLEYKESKIREIAANYESVDIASSPLYKEAFDLFAQGNLDEALALLDNAALEKIDKAAADAHILKAQLLELKYDFKNAAANYRKAAAIFPSFDNYLLVANFYYNLNQFSEAEPYYTQCLTLSKNPEDKATVLNNLGNLQRDRNEYTQAEASYQEALKIRRELAAVNPQTYLPYVATTLNNLGVLQRNMKENEKAKASFLEALKIYRDLAAVNPQTYLPYVAMTLNNLGALQSDRNENAQAEASYQEALKIRRDLATVNPQTYLPDVAMTLNNLGNLQSVRNENAQAAASYQEALAIWRTLASVNPQTYLPRLATTLANITLFYQESVPNKELSVKYAKEVLSYRAALEHIPAARQAIELAEVVLRDWET
jgi:tetratricopeptide (TPR) repeat protein